MSLWSKWLDNRNKADNPLEGIAQRINNSLNQFEIFAFVRRDVIGLAKTFKNENPPREDIIMLEYVQNKQNPQMSYYDLHDNIGRRYRENQFAQMINDIKNYFNQADM